MEISDEGSSFFGFETDSPEAPEAASVSSFSGTFSRWDTRSCNLLELPRLSTDPPRAACWPESLDLDEVATFFEEAVVVLVLVFFGGGSALFSDLVDSLRDRLDEVDGLGLCGPDFVLLDFQTCGSLLIAPGPVGCTRGSDSLGSESESSSIVTCLNTLKYNNETAIRFYM